MKDLDTIIGLAVTRERAAGVTLAMCRAVRDAYNGDLAIPLTEMSRSEQAAVANLMSVGVDQTAQRIASVMPDISFPILGREHSKRQQELPITRRNVVSGWWRTNRLGNKMGRRARHLIAYATAPVMVRPPRQTDPARVPVWHMRDPLGTFPAETADPDDVEVPDCIFTFHRSYQWLRTYYPDQTARLHRGDAKPDTKFKIVEYVDADHIVLAVLGAARNEWESAGEGGADYLTLEAIDNRAGICTAVIPGRVTLDRRTGQFDALPGLLQRQAKLMALELIAVERGIMPEQWVVARPGQQARILNVPNPMTGELGEIQGGDLNTVQVNPQFAALQNIDRLERAQRVGSQIPSEFGGESSTNIRTGRRGDAIMSATIDFPIREAQTLLATALEAENRRAIAIAKAYNGSAPRTFFFSARGGKGEVTYTPTTLFPNDEHEVFYSQPGTDANGLVITGGQRIGLGTLSKRSFMEIDPLIDDPERESDRVQAEAITAAFLSSLQAKAADGTIPPADLARIVELVTTNRAELFEAVLQVQAEAQERQAAQVEPGAPEAQPGLALPGQGAEAGVAVQPPEPGVANLAQLFTAIRRPNLALPQEMGA